MNNRWKYVFSTLLVMVVLLILSVSFLILRDYSKSVFSKNEAKTTNKEELESSNDIEDEVPTEKEEVVLEEKNDQSTGTSTNVEDNVSDNKTNAPSTNSSTDSTNTNSNNIYSPNKEASYSIIESYSGKITGYGPDCYGCTSFRTASGMYVGDGNIYYQDATFGRIRIVAADKRYPFGTIVKISNLAIYQEPIYAVVLDRGGSIGDDKHAQFDLLFTNESSARVVGLSTVNFEILRLGY